MNLLEQYDIDSSLSHSFLLIKVTKVFMLSNINPYSCSSTHCFGGLSVYVSKVKFYGSSSVSLS